MENEYSFYLDVSREEADFFLPLHECDVDVRKELYANVVPSGGTSIFPGAGECMKCAEALFQSRFTGKGASGVLDLFFSQMKRAVDIRKNFVRQCCVVRRAEVLCLPNFIGKGACGILVIFPFSDEA